MWPKAAYRVRSLAGAAVSMGGYVSTFTFTARLASIGARPVSIGARPVSIGARLVGEDLLAIISHIFISLNNI